MRPPSVVFSLTLAILLTACKTENTATGVTTPKRDDHSLFNVKKDGKWGYIDSTGKLVIGFQFDEGDEFSEGLAKICIGPCKFVKDDPKNETFDQTWQGMSGYIDTHGKIVINPHFSSASAFHRGLASVATGEFKLLKNDGLNYGYIDTSGNFVIHEQFQNAYEFDEASGLAIVCIGSGIDQHCGYIDTSGKYVINPQFYIASAFRGGLAQVIEKKDMTPSYIDRTGRIVWKGESELTLIK